MNKSQQVETWYEENYKCKSGNRFDTFKIVLKCLYERVDNPFIFETGTLRLENDFGAGYSTYIFGECLSLFGGSLLTVDINPINIETCKRITSKFSKHITYVTDNSLNTINNFEGKIDLLYLDSFDCPIEGDASESQDHNLKEFKLAEHKLHDRSLILIDDVDFPNGGKAKKTHVYLSDSGYTCLMKKQQSIWIKNECIN
jgi:predicted O-methyltransferase YrrM